MSKVFAVIPALNEAHTIATVIRSLLKHPQTNISHLLLVDDGSQDKTGPIAEAEGALVLRNPAPTGYDQALAVGVNHAFQLGADVVVTCDADGQHLVSEILKIVQPVKDGKADFCAAMRDHYNRPVERLTGLVSQVLFQNRDPFCGLKSYSRRFYQTVGAFPPVHNVGTLPFVWCAQHPDLKRLYIDIHVEPRVDESRFGNFIRGNLKLAAAFGRTLWSRVN